MTYFLFFFIFGVLVGAFSCYSFTRFFPVQNHVPEGNVQL